MLKKIILVLLATAAVGLIVYGLLPSPAAVSVAEVKKGEFREYTEDEGFTRLRVTHLISAPVNGFLHRVLLEPGDGIQAGDKIFSMEPMPAPALDARTVKQAAQNLEAAKARLRAAEAEYNAAAFRVDLAKKELVRHQKLFEQNIIPRAVLDRTQSDYDQALATEKSAKEAVSAAEYEVQNVRAVLEIGLGTRQDHDHVLTFRSPRDGIVLRRERYQEGVVSAGEIILETGSLDDLEVQVDLLSAEAVRVRPGMKVILEHWGEDADLTGKVRMVEPAGYTRVSALGVDEQRVPVFVQITSPVSEWERLGHGYRVEARIVLWEADDVVYIPTSSLFRENNQWKVFVVEDARAVLRQIKPGRRSGLLTQILEGLEPGETVITHPGKEIGHGKRVQAQ